MSERRQIWRLLVPIALLALMLGATLGGLWRLQRLLLLFFTVTVAVSWATWAQSPAPQAPSPPAQALAQNPASVTVSLDDAIQMALRHNHNLLAARTTIQQSEAEEITPRQATKQATSLWLD